MRLISCSLTEPQVRAGTKDVTRRLGWLMLKPGDRLMFCRKIMGRKKGEPLVRIRAIKVTYVHRERLDLMITRPNYGKVECRREGFSDMTPCEFVKFFCDSHAGCTPETEITRIAFKYIGPVQLPEPPKMGQLYHSLPLAQPRDM